MDDDFFPEREFLGSILSGAKIPSNITAEIFSSRKNRIIFNALQTLEPQCTSDIQILVNYLKKTEELDAAGGPAYIAELTSIVPGPSNIRFYADTLQEQSKKRETGRAIRLAAENIGKGKAGPG
jgi:replicative DNA helicase